MSAPVASRPPRTAFALPVALCIVLLPLIQAGLGYLSGRASSPWYWLAGTPVCYFLICGLGAFCAAGGIAPAMARRKGSLIGTLAGIGGAVTGALIAALVIIWSLNDARTHLTTGSRLSSGLAPLVIFFWFVPLFLGLNLLGIALAPLGGMLGGTLRARGHSRQGDRYAQERPGEPERARAWIVVVIVVIAMLLATLMGVAFIKLAVGTFP